jgi:hypothetical protein
VTLVSYVRDTGSLLLLALLSQILMVLGLASLAFIVTRHLMWWIKGNRTA